MRSKFFLVMISWFFCVSALAADKDIRIPTKLWEKIEEVSGGSKDGTLAFFPVSVVLKEKTSSVLTESEVKIDLPRGGGEIDLAKYVRSDKGTFAVSFEIEGYDKPDDLQVYFISQSRKRKIDGDIWGAGCRKFLDIKSFFVNKVLKEGILVNTTRNRHLTVLGGNFVFVRKNGKQMLLSQVTFTDSSQPNLFCAAQGAE